MSRAYNWNAESGKPYNWTPDEIDTLQRLHMTTRICELVPIIGRSKHAIVGQMLRQGLTSFNPAVWTSEQLDAIRAATPGTVARNLARKIGRSTHAVHHKAQELGIMLTTNRPWIPEQAALLRANAAVMDLAELAALIGRTERSVHMKADLLGIKLKPTGRLRNGRFPRAPQPPKRRYEKTAPIALAPARKQPEVSCLENCPQCRAPVSNWAQHYERMGHRRPA